MIRTLGGIAGGIGVAILVMIVIEAIGNQVAPPPMGLERSDAAARMPLETLAFPLAGWFLGPLAGGMTAIRVSGRRWASWPVAAAVLIGALLQFALAGQPAWMIAAGIAAPIAGAWLAQLVVRRRAEDQASDPA